jgi:hypothetical protein
MKYGFCKNKKKWEVQGSNLAPPSIKQPAEPLGYVQVAINIALRLVLNYTEICVAHPNMVRHA